MATRDARATDHAPVWNPGEFALWRGRWADPKDASPTAVVLRHPAAPFVRYVDKDDEETLQGCAHEYLVQADSRAKLDLPKAWLDALRPLANAPTFGWLPIRPLSDRDLDPMESYRFVRPPRGAPKDETVILLASEHLGKKSNGQGVAFLGSEFGLRVVAHIRPGARGGRREVRITSMSASLPFGIYGKKASVGEWESTGVNIERFHAAYYKALPDFKRRVSGALGLWEKSVFFRRLRIATWTAGKLRFELLGTSFDETDLSRDRVTPRPGAPHHSFIVAGTASITGGDLSLESVRKVPLVADATAGTARVFPQDPASHQGPKSLRGRRPTRPERELNRCREVTQIGSGKKAELTRGGFLEVVSSRFVRSDPPSGTRKTVRLPGDGPPVFSNDFAAVSAYQHLGQLFDALQRYEIDPVSYFRVAELPVKAVYRSGVRPGPGKDGQTVNARVLPSGWRADFFAPTNPGERPALEVHFALATLSRRARRPWNGVAPSQAEPLGIAADARWVWHEIGHVLLMAAVGELEFRFAHSAGDALAAIVADPRSKLAMDERWRGATFPWVFVPRRHDRCVLHGWSWCGALHRPASLLAEPERLRRKGYWSEQILSSSLFRLYRCLGGDTTDGAGAGRKPDGPTRQAASDYTAYLIIRAIGLLGYSGAVPAHHADHFVSALIDADVGTGQFTVSVSDGKASRKCTRVGGCAYKVIRWAFEAQGMYAKDVPSSSPGMPEPVDIYIKDGRPTVDRTPHGDIEYRPGSYMPVSLDWGVAGGAPPAWHATETAIERVGNRLFVTVGNRGSKPAKKVQVSVWWRKWPANGNPPAWDPQSGWTPCGAQGAPAMDIAPGRTKRFGPFAFAPSARGRYLILAQATCADDRANTDPATGLPCAQVATPLVDLVANDNNLGLRVVNVP